MTAKLTKELAAALHATGESELEVVDPDTQRLYFVVDAEVHRQAMEALRRQQDRDAIARSIAEMEAGAGDLARRGVRRDSGEAWATAAVFDRFAVVISCENSSMSAHTSDRTK